MINIDEKWRNVFWKKSVRFFLPSLLFQQMTVKAARSRSNFQQAVFSSLVTHLVPTCKWTPQGFQTSKKRQLLQQEQQHAVLAETNKAY